MAVASWRYRASETGGADRTRLTGRLVNMGSSPLDLPAFGRTGLAPFLSGRSCAGPEAPLRTAAKKHDPIGRTVASSAVERRQPRARRAAVPARPGEPPRSTNPTGDTHASKLRPRYCVLPRRERGPCRRSQNRCGVQGVRRSRGGSSQGRDLLPNEQGGRGGGRRREQADGGGGQDRRLYQAAWTRAREGLECGGRPARGLARKTSIQ